VGDSLVAKPRLDPLVTLGAAAARTQRVRIGTAVLLGALYQPVLLARAAASLDVLSRGRLVLAMGVGGAFTPAQRGEWAAAGVDARQRARRLEEVVELLPRLWSGEPVTFSGRHFQLEAVRLEPKPVQRPRIPIWLACHHHSGSAAQYHRAARLADGVVSITDSPEEFAAMWQQVRRYVVECGRDPERFERAFYLTVNLDPVPERACAEADAFIKQYYGRNWWGDRWGPYGDPMLAVERIWAYAEAGAQHVIVRFAAFDQARQMELFERYVLAKLPLA
jgi:probable F420-dependent oxidoreductase